MSALPVEAAAATPPGQGSSPRRRLRGKVDGVGADTALRRRLGRKLV